jgi:hypothetical protein
MRGPAQVPGASVTLLLGLALVAVSATVADADGQRIAIRDSSA